MPPVDEEPAKRQVPAVPVVPLVPLQVPYTEASRQATPKEELAVPPVGRGAEGDREIQGRSKNGEAKQSWTSSTGGRGAGTEGEGLLFLPAPSFTVRSEDA
jgi:hypothetical protein